MDRASNTGTARWTPVAKQTALEAEGLLETEVEGRPVLLVWHDGNVHAFQALCPHDHARLCAGRVEGAVIVCPRHRARFRLADGGAEPGFDLPALAAYPARVAGGGVEVDAAAIAPRATERWDLTR